MQGLAALSIGFILLCVLICSGWSVVTEVVGLDGGRGRARARARVQDALVGVQTPDSASADLATPPERPYVAVQDDAEVDLDARAQGRQIELVRPSAELPVDEDDFYFHLVFYEVFSYHPYRGSLHKA